MPSRSLPTKVLPEEKQIKPAGSASFLPPTTASSEITLEERKKKKYIYTHKINERSYKRNFSWQHLKKKIIPFSGQSCVCPTSPFPTHAFLFGNLHKRWFCGQAGVCLRLFLLFILQPSEPGGCGHQANCGQSAGEGVCGSVSGARVGPRFPRWDTNPAEILCEMGDSLFTKNKQKIKFSVIYSPSRISSFYLFFFPFCFSLRQFK